MHACAHMCDPLVPSPVLAALLPVAQHGAGQRSCLGSRRGKLSRRFHGIFFFLLWIIVCASAFLNKMPLSSLWGPLSQSLGWSFYAGFYPLCGRL